METEASDEAATLATGSLDRAMIRSPHLPLPFPDEGVEDATRGEPQSLIELDGVAIGAVVAVAAMSRIVQKLN